jgi:hypothetical protein
MLTKSIVPQLCTDSDTILMQRRFPSRNVPNVGVNAPSNTIYELRISRIGHRYRVSATVSGIIDAHCNYDNFNGLVSVLSLLGFTPSQVLSLSVRLNSSKEVPLRDRSFHGSLLTEVLGIPQPD